MVFYFWPLFGFVFCGVFSSSFLGRASALQIQNALGGNVLMIGTGSAPITVEVMDFLKIAFACQVIEGYGALIFIRLDTLKC
jgi:hypothetical protein